MQSNKTIFFSIIGLSIGAVIIMALVRAFLFDSLDLPAAPGKVDIEVVVAPSIKPWVDQLARNYNQANSDAQVRVVAAGELVPAKFISTNPQQTPPAAWLAEASFVVDLAGRQGLQFEQAQSVAGAELAWGMYNSKLDEFNQSYGTLNWESIHAKGSTEGLKLIIASPQNGAEGLAALISATAAHVGKDSLTASDVSTADGWLTETFGNRNTQIPATPATDFATKGVSAGDIGILTMASWRANKLTERADFTVNPTQPAVALDYPFVIWSGASSDAKSTALAFQNFLLQSGSQTALGQYAFEAAGSVSNGVQINGEAVQRLLDWTNRGLR